MAVKQRLKEYIKYKDIKISQFCRTIGVSQAFVSSMRKSIQPDKIESIALNYPDLNTGWLLTGEGSMLKTKSKFSGDTYLYQTPESIIKAPLISQYANGGYLRGYADPEYLEEQPAFYSTRKHGKGNYVAFEVRGESMNDGSINAICEGDILLGMELKKEYWQPGVKLHIPKVFVIVHKTEGITVKEIIEHDKDTGRIFCHCWNKEPEYEDFELNLVDIVQLFYIKEINRSVKY